jgi:hypothetical protein
MSNAFSNFLGGVMDGSGDLRDYQHASRLYVSNFYELAPKAGWIYYVVLNVNPELLTKNAIKDPKFRANFQAWVTKYKGSVGLLAKQVDLPKFTMQTEILNQYNRKVVVQKQLTYSSVAITFHDDMANSTTDMWKHYYQYNIADSVSKTNVGSKFQDTKYKDYVDPGNSFYGLSNGQETRIPFFTSIDVYQLHKQRFTSFKLVNPVIKEWAHDTLDQTQGNKMLTSKMTVDYETVVYNTDATNRVTRQNPGFTTTHYDTTPSPLRIGGKGNNSIFGAGGIINGAGEVFGDLASIASGNASPLDILNTAIKGGNLVKNVKKVSSASLKAEGYSILNSTLANIATTPVTVVNTDGSISKAPAADRVSQGLGNTISGIKQIISPVGVNLYNGNNSSVSNQTQATAKKLGN